MTKLPVRDREIAELVRIGFLLIPVVRLAGLDPGRSGGRRLTRKALASISVSAFWPVLLNVSLLAAGEPAALQTLRANLWLTAFALVNLVGLACAGRSWSLLEQAAPSLDELTRASPGKAELHLWFARVLSVRLQLGVAGIFAACGATALWVVMPGISGNLEVNWLSVACVGWTGAIFGNCVYWLIALPDLLRRVLRLPGLRWVWHSPASTPGIAQLSGVFAFSSLMALLVAVGAQLLALRAASYGDSTILDASTTVFPILGAFLTVVVGLLPHWWLYVAVRDVRRASLSRLLPLTGEEVPGSAQSADSVHAYVELYRLVEGSPGLPFSTATMIQYGAAIAGSLVAFLLGK